MLDKLNLDRLYHNLQRSHPRAETSILSIICHTMCKIRTWVESPISPLAYTGRRESSVHIPKLLIYGSFIPTDSYIPIFNLRFSLCLFLGSEC